MYSTIVLDTVEAPTHVPTTFYDQQRPSSTTVDLVDFEATGSYAVLERLLRRVDKDKA